METDSDMHLNAFEIVRLAMVAFFVPTACFFIYLLNQNEQLWWRFDRRRLMMIAAMFAVTLSGLLAIFSILAGKGANNPTIPLVPADTDDRRQ